MTTGFVKAPGARYPRTEMAPGDSLVFDQNWADPDDRWLKLGATLLTINFTITPAGLTKSEESHTDTTSQLRINAAGATKQVYLVTASITDSLGNAAARSFEILVVTL